MWSKTGSSRSNRNRKLKENIKTWYRGAFESHCDSEVNQCLIRKFEWNPEGNTSFVVALDVRSHVKTGWRCNCRWTYWLGSRRSLSTNNHSAAGRFSKRQHVSSDLIIHEVRKSFTKLQEAEWGFCWGMSCRHFKLWTVFCCCSLLTFHGHLTF